MNEESSFLSNLQKSYSLLLDRIVYLSSVFFFCGLLTVLFFKSGDFFENLFNNLSIFTISFFILSHFYAYFEKYEKIKIIGEYLREFIPIAGSFLVLFHFLNLYFPISILLKEYFLAMWKIVENLFNELFLICLIFVLFVPIPIGFIFQKFIFEAPRRAKNKKTENIFVVFGTLLCIVVEIALINFIFFLIRHPSPLPYSFGLI